MKTFFLSLLIISNIANAAGLRSAHNKNFMPRDSSVCGWHVEVSGNQVVVDSIPNSFNLEGTQDCWGMQSLLFNCNGTACTQVGGTLCNSETKEIKADNIAFLADGNMFYQNNCTGRGFKNYRY